MSEVQEVEAGLQDYLQKKRLPELFKDIVHQILMAKPDNAILFTMDYLSRKYSNEFQELCKIHNLIPKGKDSQIDSEKATNISNVNEVKESKTEAQDKTSEKKENAAPKSEPEVKAEKKVENLENKAVSQESITISPQTVETKTHDDSTPQSSLHTVETKTEDSPHKQEPIVNPSSHTAETKTDDVSAQSSPHTVETKTEDAPHKHEPIVNPSSHTAETKTHDAPQTSFETIHSNIEPNEAKAQENDQKLPDTHSTKKVGFEPVVSQEPPAETKESEAIPVPSTSKPNSSAEPESEDDEPNHSPREDAPLKAFNKTRKAGVSAESVDAEKMKDQMKNITNIPKSPEVAGKLMTVVGKSALLRSLDEDQKALMVNAFSGPIIKNPGEDIIVQGAIGDVFYLIEEGLVDVYISKKGNAPMKVHTYKPGDAFGELAIMYNAPRAATCRAQTEATIWALDRISFKCIVVAAAMQKREMFQGFLSIVPVLGSLSELEIMTLADSLSEETYLDGAIICTEGEEGNYFYIVKEGVAECFKKTPETENQEIVKTITTGDYFGELALLTPNPRQATVKAKGILKVLAIDRATFTRVLGPLSMKTSY